MKYQWVYIRSNGFRPTVQTAIEAKVALLEKDGWSKSTAYVNIPYNMVLMQKEE